MSEPRIVINFASRSRPTRFFEALDSIYKLAANPDDFGVHCVLDTDDNSMNNHDVIGKLATYNNLRACFDKSEGKIHAINRDLHMLGLFDILVNFSDDMKMTAYGWDTLIRDGFRINAPDYDGFLHYPDSSAGIALSTMHVVGKKYHDRFGYIFHPSYISLWADNENQDVAKKLGKYFYMGIPIFDHYHPAYRMVEWDEQYRRQQDDKIWAKDELNFNERKEKNFGL